MKYLLSIYQSLVNVEVEYNETYDVEEKKRLANIYKQVIALFTVHMSGGSVPDDTSGLSEALDKLYPSEDISKSPLYGLEYEQVCDTVKSYLTA